MKLLDKRKLENKICDELDILDRMLKSKYPNERFRDELLDKRDKLCVELIKLGLQPSSELCELDNSEYLLEKLIQERKILSELITNARKKVERKKGEMKQLEDKDKIIRSINSRPRRQAKVIL